MENDLDIKLYNEYLNGEKEAFELLYNKYKDKITYFIYNIVKDYQKSEDIAQDVFIYVLQNKLKEGYSFKHYIYMVAKSRAINYINTENRRNEISSEYLLQEEQQTYQDVSDIQYILIRLKIFHIRKLLIYLKRQFQMLKILSIEAEISYE